MQPDDDTPTDGQERTQPERTTNPLNSMHGRVGGAREVEIREREGEMLSLRKAGVSVTEIAQRYEIHHSRVSHIIHRALRRVAQRPALEYKELLLQQLDDLIRAWWRPALGIPELNEAGERIPREPDERAAAVLLRAFDQVAKLQGFNTLVLEMPTMSQEERAEALADSMRAYMKGREDMRAEAEALADATANGDAP